MPRDAVTAIATGTALGVVSRLGDSLPGAWAGPTNLGGPWLLVAFGLGTVTTSGTGAGTGSTAVACAVGSYYACMVATQGGAGQDRLLPVALLWLSVGLAAGAGFGWMGRKWRHGSASARALAIAAVAGAFVGEAVARLVGYGPDLGAVTLAAELAAGLGAPLALLRSKRRLALATGTAVAPVATVVTAEVLQLARLAVS